jgi:ribosome assembly protein YihI (activator of Der GTPase)
MLDIEFLEQVADYYGSFSLDEFAERLGVSSVDVVMYVEDLLDRNLDVVKEEMGITDDDGED